MKTIDLESVNRSSCLTGFCQLFRSQWRCDVNDVKRNPLRDEGRENEMGVGGGKGEMKRKHGKERETIVMDLGRRYRRRNSRYHSGGRGRREG